MKVFLLFLFLNSETGDILSSVDGGAMVSLPACHSAIAQLLKGLPVPPDLKVVPVCIDTTVLPHDKPKAESKPGEILTTWAAQ